MTRPIAPFIVAVVLVSAACTPSSTSSGTVPSAPSDAPASPSPSQPPSDAVEPTATPALPVGWEPVLEVRVEPPEASVADDVVYGDAGFLALTQRYQQFEGGPGVTGRSMWQSVDGRTWEELPLPLAEERNESVQVLTTTRGGEYVLFTTFSFDDGGTIVFVTRALQSADGVTWDEIDTGLPEGIQITGIDHGAVGSLLIGSIFTDDTSDSGAWLSDDGVAWERVLDLDEPGRFVNADGGAGAEGFAIVGISTALDFDESRYFSYASSDGRDWIAGAPTFPDVPGFVLDPFVTALGGDWVAALTTRPDESVQFWFSSNGLDWEVAGLVERDRPLSAFAPVFGEFDGRLYFSTVGGSPDGDPGIWTSANGLSWEAVDLAADAYLGGLAVGPGVVVLHATARLEEGLSWSGAWVHSTD